ncbi:MAG: diguanylate cyclase [Cyanobacteriota bacterium]|nr:diguanylate cyclase [Cyanobacteriota bacterium]
MASIPGFGIGLFAAVLLAGGLASWQLQRQLSGQLLQQALRSQQLKVQGDVDRFNASLSAAERSIAVFAALVSAIDPATPPQAAQPLPFSALVRQDADGVWRSPAEQVQSGRQAGIWIPPLVSLTTPLRAFFSEAQAITTVYGLGASQMVVENTWVLPLTGGEVIFWPARPDFVRHATAQLDYRPTAWVQLTAPAVNPSGRPRWTRPQYDPAARDWLISVVAPFEERGRWAGSVGHDLVLRDLLRWLMPSESRSRSGLLAQPLYVGDLDGGLLVREGAAIAPGARLPSDHSKVLATVPADGQVYSLDLHGDHLLVAPLPRLQAMAVFKVDGTAIDRLVAQELLPQQLGLAVFMGLLLSVALLLLGQEVAFRRREQQLLERRNRELELLVQQRTEALERANRQLSQLAAEDPLTGLGNRRSFEEVLGRVWGLARRRRQSVALAMVDVDHFKAYNDAFGHPAGDACLRAVAQQLRTGLRRQGDSVFRFGGEEFVLLLPDIDADQALHCCELLRQQLEAQAMAHPFGLVTVSIGVAAARPDSENGDVKDLLARADAALYRAKSEGRNRVLLA